MSAGMTPAADQLLLDWILDEISSSFACIDIQAGDAPGVVVVEQEAGGLLVGVVEGLAAVVASEQSGTQQGLATMSGTFWTLTPCGQDGCSHRLG